MNTWTQTFESSNARFQVENRYGVLIRATNLTESYVGRGIYHELFRDHEWLNISRITPRSDGQIEIEYLEQKTFQSESTEGNSTTKITDEKVIRQTLIFQRDDDVLLSANLVAPPKGRRIKVVTTRTEEPLDD